jgi:hypothetical protein
VSIVVVKLEEAKVIAPKLLIVQLDHCIPKMRDGGACDLPLICHELDIPGGGPATIQITRQ